MDQEAFIRTQVENLLREHGDAASVVAEEKMREEMDKGDVVAAGVWLTVMYEITRATIEETS